MILASTVWPMYGCSSRTRRSSTSEAGRNPRRPMSTIRPPLTTSITTPLTISSRFLISSMFAQAFSYCARFLERTSRPSLSSFISTRHSTRSPIETISDGSTSLRIESSREGITPSDLKPMSRRTSSWSIFTTVPTTRSPSSNSRTLLPTSSARSVPTRLSSVITRGTYVPSALKVPICWEERRLVASVMRTSNTDHTGII